MWRRERERRAGNWRQKARKRGGWRECGERKLSDSAGRTNLDAGRIGKALGELHGQPLTRLGHGGGRSWAGERAGGDGNDAGNATAGTPRPMAAPSSLASVSSSCSQSRGAALPPYHRFGTVSAPEGGDGNTRL